MPALTARREQRSTNTWPGFVDALATLLMVIIFLLMIFVLAQFFLSHAISGRDEALRKLQIEISDLTDILALEKKTNASLLADLKSLSSELQASVEKRDRLSNELSNLQIKADSTRKELGRAFKTILNQENALKQTVEIGAQRAETISTQKTELIKLTNDIAALQALRQNLVDKLKKLTTQLELSQGEYDLIERKIIKTNQENKELKASAMENNRLFLEERRISENSRAQLALLNQQMAELRQQLIALNEALEIKEKEIKTRNIQIKALGKKLNVALANKVQELNKYRSEFFGKLRELINKTGGIRVVGDRFVFQSEVLFEKGSALLGTAGQKQLNRIALTLLKIAKQIPEEIDWILRIDGHTDSDPISTTLFPTNWELSTARAISVVKHLIKAGIPPNRLAAAGFGQHSMLDPRQDEIAKRRNRRIELKLTQR
ncbi:MAG: hypothetical protein CFH06_01294 [Alphaproteobacteria bacterium MarineAlpha3_Bin5]|nr:hypothetical protein [Magnetovibrio sp.]PPR77403.1 MAG: hypothetical protein CFH06_01294 [Alphaproteobacteria bacterium MarineAlpha3_Bin5]